MHFLCGEFSQLNLNFLNLNLPEIEECKIYLNTVDVFIEKTCQYMRRVCK